MKNGPDVVPALYFNRADLISNKPDLYLVIENEVRKLLVEQNGKTFAQQKTIGEALKIKVVL